jgi:hypothetical protein
MILKILEEKYDHRRPGFLEQLYDFKLLS